MFGVCVVWTKLKLCSIYTNRTFSALQTP
uniref:Uncharacterized protein n=1 Tax=Arundo donax TaxID=35708 RepID=A0A0A8ZJA2_ARUDO